MTENKILLESIVEMLLHRLRIKYFSYYKPYKVYRYHDKRNRLTSHRIITSPSENQSY